MAEDGEVVNGDDERPRGTQRTAVGRAMQNVGHALATEHDGVPHAVAAERGQTIAAPERAQAHLDVVPALELAEQSLEIARRAGTGLDERRDVDRNAHHSASA